ncbi:MAG: hypothetical protein E6G83_08050 [Alphaproteobacteria bacterium]|nr:MAG: hypothetical protein E6G83_08050 [Alphaproteobacteria bacterium]
MVPGVAVAMGGQDWIVPPLTLGQLRRLMPKVRQLTEIGVSMGEAQINVLIDIVAAALQRNYTEMTPDKVENLLDLGNASAVLNAVLTGSGLKPGGAAMGEASAPGTSPGADGARARSVSDVISETLNPGEKSMVSSRPPVDTATP